MTSSPLISDLQRQEISRALVHEASEDIVSLWLVQGWVEDAAGSDADPVEVRKATVSLVVDAVKAGVVVAGSFEGREFRIWNADADELRAKIFEKYKKLSQDFDPTDNIWICAPDLNYRRLKY